MPSRSRIFKIALIGDTSTGKTTLLQRYLTGQFSENLHATLGVNFNTKTFAIGEDIIMLQIWDFGGNDRFHFIVSSYCKDIDAILFVYDITRPESLLKLEKWQQEFSANETRAVFLIVGTKSDLNFKRKQQTAEVAAYSKTQTCVGVIEVSSKTGENVNLVFDTIVKNLLNQHITGESSQPE